mmetsp:Transcript_10420/g.63686  ORF Transcript_10420/g.63686 Transcript_10420/m.63686 type:complete len:83 (+) Transcript_10420:3073-3321(+)
MGMDGQARRAVGRVGGGGGRGARDRTREKREWWRWRRARARAHTVHRRGWKGSIQGGASVDVDGGATAPSHAPVCLDVSVKV